MYCRPPYPPSLHVSPLHQARVNWIRELHRVIAVVTHLPRLRSSQFDHGLDVVVQGKDARSGVPTFETLLTRLDGSLLDHAYTVVEATMEVVNTYANKWFTYQVGCWWWFCPFCGTAPCGAARLHSRLH